MAVIIPKYPKVYTNLQRRVKKSFNRAFKLRYIDKTNNAGNINEKMISILKYFKKCKTTLKIPLIDCEINLVVTWSAGFIVF